MSKKIYMPHITNLNQLFSGFKYSDGPGHPYLFVSSPLSKSLGEHTYDPKRDVVTVRKSKFCNLYVSGISPELKATVEPHMIGYIGSFEIVKWSDNQGYLVLARDCHNIGSRWITMLPPDYDLLQHLNAEEKAMLQASEDSFQEAIKDAPETSSYKSDYYKRINAR